MFVRPHGAALNKEQAAAALGAFLRASWRRNPPERLG
jgi:hypothetical protein